MQKHDCSSPLLLLGLEEGDDVAGARALKLAGVLDLDVDDDAILDDHGVAEAAIAQDLDVLDEVERLGELGLGVADHDDLALAVERLVLRGKNEGS